MPSTSEVSTCLEARNDQRYTSGATGLQSDLQHQLLCEMRYGVTETSQTCRSDERALMSCKPVLECCESMAVFLNPYRRVAKS